MKETMKKEMENMMPRCMNMMFSELEVADRKTLAETMLSKMTDELKGAI